MFLNYSSLNSWWKTWTSHQQFHHSSRPIQTEVCLQSTDKYCLTHHASTIWNSQIQSFDLATNVQNSLLFLHFNFQVFQFWTNHYQWPIDLLKIWHHPLFGILDITLQLKTNDSTPDIHPSRRQWHNFWLPGGNKNLGMRTWWPRQWPRRHKNW